MQNMQERIKGKELKYFSLFSLCLLLAAAAAGTAVSGGLLRGLWKIIVSRDALITDYFELAGYGAAFLNAAAVFAMSVGLVLTQKTPFTGLTMAALFINAGYALWGKNPWNILPVFLGTAIYARSHGARLGRYIYTAGCLPDSSCRRCPSMRHPCIWGITCSMWDFPAVSLRL